MGGRAIEELEEWLIDKIHQLSEKRPRWGTGIEIEVYTKMLSQLRKFVLEERKP